MVSLKEKPLVYSAKTSYNIDVKAFYCQDVKEAVLELIKWHKSLKFENLTIESEDLQDKIYHNDRIDTNLQKIKEIFGDFEEYKSL